MNYICSCEKNDLLTVPKHKIKKLGERCKAAIWADRESELATVTLADTCERASCILKPIHQLNPTGWEKHKYDHIF